jgi:hypothetical protein
MTTDNLCFYSQNRLIQTSQTGGQRFSDTSPFSIPCPMLRMTRNFFVLYSCMFVRLRVQGFESSVNKYIQMEKLVNSKTIVQFSRN